MNVVRTSNLAISALASVCDALFGDVLLSWGGSAAPAAVPLVTGQDVETRRGVTRMSTCQAFRLGERRTIAAPSSPCSSGSGTSREIAVTPGLYCRRDADSAPGNAGSAMVRGCAHDW